MKSIIGHDFYSIYSHEYDGDFFIAPKGFKTSAIIRNLAVLKDTIQSDAKDKTEDKLEYLGIITDIKFVMQYNFNLSFSENGELKNGNVLIYFQIQHPETKKYSYFSINQFHSSIYGKYNVCDCSGCIYSMNDLIYSSEKINSSYINPKFADYAYDRRTNKQGYVFDLIVGVSFKHKQYKEITNTILAEALYNSKKDQSEQEFFTYPHLETTIQYYYLNNYINKKQLDTFMSTWGPQIDVYNLYSKYRIKALVLVEKFLINFEQNRIQKMLEIKNNFKRIKEAI
jgi:hypothetical protein